VPPALFFVEVLAGRGRAAALVTFVSKQHLVASLLGYAVSFGAG